MKKFSNEKILMEFLKKKTEIIELISGDNLRETTGWIIEGS